MIPVSDVCPVCNKTIQLSPKVGDEQYLIGICDCGAGHYRNVIQMDNPNFKPLSERLEPGEPEPPKNWKRSKKL